MNISYSASRLTFLKDKIDPLSIQDKIRIYVYNDNCTYEMTKGEFYNTFGNVVISKSYRHRRRAAGGHPKGGGVS